MSGQMLLKCNLMSFMYFSKGPFSPSRHFFCNQLGENGPLEKYIKTQHLQKNKQNNCLFFDQQAMNLSGKEEV